MASVAYKPKYEKLVEAVTLVMECPYHIGDIPGYCPKCRATSHLFDVFKELGIPIPKEVD